MPPPGPDARQPERQATAIISRSHDGATRSDFLSGDDMGYAHKVGKITTA
jgi:hypothetical protein